MSDLIAAAQTIRETLRTPTLPVRVAEILQELIITGRIPPGERIVEEDLAKELGISRTSLREAMIGLESEGLLTRKEGRSRVIYQLTARDVAELYEVWAFLECEAVVNASINADTETWARIRDLLDRMDEITDQQTYHRLNLELHRALVERCTNRKLLSLYDSTVRQVRWAWNLAISQAGEPEQSQREHVEIFAAFKEKDTDRVRRLVRAHLVAGAVAMTGGLTAEASNE